VRELWVSFRLLLLLAAYVGAGAAVTVLPAAAPIVLARLSVGVGAAVTFGAAIAAWSLSRERTLGRVGWLTTRSVSRGTILIGWFVALALVSLAGIVVAGALGWLAVSTPSARLDPYAFAMTFAAVASASLALLALGLALGALLRPLVAALGAAAASFAILAIPWAAAPRIATPVEALAHLPELERPLSVAAQGAGVGLALAAVLLLAARLALSRVDL
jgi:ABC-type transport system involved in multi-copper enzyme maturation permease subunit